MKKQKRPHYFFVENEEKKKIFSTLFPEDVCFSCQGFFREWNEKEKKFKIKPEKLANCTHIRKTLLQINSIDIYIATDNYFTGELLAWHICDEFQLSLDVNRMLFEDMTKPSLLHSFYNPVKVNTLAVEKKLEEDREERKSGSLFLGVHSFQAKVLMSIEEEEKDEEEEEAKWQATFFSFDLIFHEKGFTQSLPLDPHFHKVAHQVVQEKIMVKIPFNTVDLLNVSKKHLSLATHDTLKLAQELYQDGYITFFKTDSTKYSAVFIETAKEFISAHYDQDFFSLTPTEEKEAIRCTNFAHVVIFQRDKSKKAALYRMIRQRTIESCLPSYQANVYEYILKGETQELEYFLEIPTCFGWKNATLSSLDQQKIVDKTRGIKTFLHMLSPNAIHVPKSSKREVKKEQHEDTVIAFETWRVLDKCREKKFISSIDHPKLLPLGKIVVDILKDQDTKTPRMYFLDDRHVINLTRNGPVIINTEENILLPVKKTIVFDVQALIEKKYTLDYLVDLFREYLGFYMGEDIFLTQGIHGLYFTLKGKNYNLDRLQKKREDIQLGDIIWYLETQENKILRQLDEFTSVRKRNRDSRPYIFHQPCGLKPPVFFSLETFSECPVSCPHYRIRDFLWEKYEITLKNS